jgi:hypothetical protein
LFVAAIVLYFLVLVLSVTYVWENIVGCWLLLKALSNEIAPNPSIFFCTRKFPADFS